MLTVEEFLDTAKQYIGFPAVKFGDYDPFLAGNNPSGFDCSGLWQFILRISKVNLHRKELGREIRFAREFFDYLGTNIRLGEEVKGDLVFFSYCGAMPTHMGLYLGEGRIMHKGFVETSVDPNISPTGDYPKRIIVSELSRIANDRRNAGVPIRHIIRRGEQKFFTNPIGFKRFLPYEQV